MIFHIGGHLNLKTTSVFYSIVRSTVF